MIYGQDSRKFLLHEKAIEYDEYDDKLKSSQDQGYTCITKLSSLEQNISKDVLEVDVMQYIEENWPLDDEDVASMHKQFRLVGYIEGVRARSFKYLERSVFDHFQLVFTNAYGASFHRLMGFIHGLNSLSKICSKTLADVRTKMSKII